MASAANEPSRINTSTLVPHLGQETSVIVPPYTSSALSHRRLNTVKGFTFRANTLAKQKSFAETLAKAKEWIGVARQLAEDVGNSKI